MSYAPVPIDLSRVPAPNAIDPLDFEALFDAYASRFVARWEQARGLDPSLPAYDVADLQTGSLAVDGQAYSETRLLDRARVNDAVRSVLVTLAKGADLDNVVARQGVVRLEVEAGVFETDDQLLWRYLLSFGRASAGSADRILFDAYTAWPAMLTARVNGRAIHGRRGETDLVIAGPAGDTPPDKVALVRSIVTAPSAKPEAIGIFVLPATKLLYGVEQTISVPVGPDAELVRLEAEARVRRVTDDRRLIGGSVQRDLIAGAAYGASIGGVSHVAPPQDVAANPYEIPICSGIAIDVEVVG